MSYTVGHSGGGYIWVQAPIRTYASDFHFSLKPPRVHFALSHSPARSKLVVVVFIAVVCTVNHLVASSRGPRFSIDNDFKRLVFIHSFIHFPVGHNDRRLC